MFPDEVDNHPTTLPTLDVLEIETGCLGAS
jgi:hypothetical protein